MTRTTVGSDVVVVGGGQAGLAIGYHLARQDRNFTILEAAAQPAAAWRARWDSPRPFTPPRSPPPAPPAAPLRPPAGEAVSRRSRRLSRSRRGGGVPDRLRA